MSMIRYGFMISVGLGLASVVSCGGGDDPGKGGGDGDTGTGDGDGDGDISLGDGDTGVGDGDTGDGDGGIDGCMPFEAEGCSGITYEGENVPLSIYVMYDLSCSMSCDVEGSGCCQQDNPVPESEWRIQPVRAAMTSFLQDPASAGIYVGLGFFGDHGIGDNNDSAVCNVQAHTDTEADIAQLPGAADNLIEIVQNGQPQGGTPTHLAIEGACVYSNSYKAANPAHKVVILLVTDGIPEYSCNADIEQAVDAAESCYDDGAGRETYVLGVVAGNNNSLDQLNAIADAGGTEMAYLTDVDDIEGSVLAALNAIRADAIIPCTLNVPQPETGTIDYGQVNVGICDAAEETVHTYYVEDPADCDNGAWYYEQLGDEQVVQLCDQTCDTVSAAGASLTMTVGCETIVVPVR